MGFMKKILFSIILGIFITAILCKYSDKVQADLAQNLVRLHVIANSDTEEDQTLKLKVRDAIINYIQPNLNSSTNAQMTKEFINQEINNIKQIALDTIKKEGKNYTVEAYLGVSDFPTKVYGDVALPAGNYEALKVIIGNGQGKNWWCVLFPPLCFVDATHGIVPESSKQQLQNVLSKEEYDIIVNSKNKDEIPVEIKFKVVEWWQKTKQKAQTAFQTSK